MLAGFTVDDPDVVLLGRETIYRNGERVGWLTSGGFGHTIGKPIGYGYIRQPDGGLDEQFVRSGSYELEVAMQRLPCAVHTGPLFDPKMERVKM
jgi:4-methylaminobutanoate oxidase (formaldehyde-forming)